MGKSFTKIMLSLVLVLSTFFAFGKVNENLSRNKTIYEVSSYQKDLSDHTHLKDSFPIEEEESQEEEDEETKEEKTLSDFISIFNEIYFGNAIEQVDSDSSYFSLTKLKYPLYLLLEVFRL